MSISSIIVGGQGCSISKLISTLRSCSSFHMFHEKFSDISIDLETPRDVIKKFRQDLLLDKFTLVDVVCGLIEDWVARNGSGATLQELMGILKENNLTDCAESLEKAFDTSNDIPTEYRKYSRLPPGVQDFLFKTNQLKTICIIPTIDLSITCENLCENQEGCVVHGYVDFLKIISVLPPSGNKDPTYFATMESLKQIKKVFTEIFDQPGRKIGLVVVTPQDNLEGLVDLLQSHPNWEQAVVICADPMEWNDLTLAYRNEIEEKVKERFHVELDEDDEGLSGQVLVDVIQGKDFKLFKDTFPEELSYYVYRTIITRNYISTSIFTGTPPDIFLFKGMKRYELSGFVKNKLTDNSTNQIRQKIGKVNHIILDHQSHFEKICEKTNAPVHLLHFEEGRLKWLKSRRGVSLLQKNVEESQMPLREKLFCENFGTDTNFPVIIADSPGMGKSVLLAQIGKTLASTCPAGGTVFFILVAEFMKQIQESGAEGNAEGVKICLQNMLCENVVGKLMLNSKLNSAGGILVELLMDGFDELNPRDSEQALGILRIIVESFKSIRLWVTSRQHLLYDLENAIDTLGYNIQPFDEEDQIQFLTGYWSREKNSYERRLRKYAMECLRVLKSNMSSKEKDIAGIPLQCLLIGEVYEEEAIAYADSEEALFPTIVASSITDLYSSMVSKKFKKYRDVHVKVNGEESVDDEALMNIHARFSIELIFPEHIGKLQHCFVPVHLEDVLKVGILESTSPTATPRFIHRTFAEYFAAWFFLNHFKTPEPTGTFVGGLFSCQDTFTSDVGIDSFAFANPVVCYFIDSLITNPSSVDHNDMQSISNSLNTEDVMRNIAHSCVNADLVQLFKVFLRANKFEKFEKAIFNKDLLLLAIEKSSIELVGLILDMLEKHQDFDLAFQTASLRVGVRRGDYSIVEFLINERGLRLIIEEVAEETRTILHDCVSETSNNSVNVIKRKIDVIRLITSLQPELLEKTNEEGQTPLLVRYVHVQLMIELIRQGANVLAKDLNNDTILQLRQGWRNLSRDDFHLLLTSIPQDKLKLLVQMKGKHDHTPLASLVAVLDPAPETLIAFKDAGADFNCEDESGVTLMQTAIKKGRNEKTLRKVAQCGANAVGWRGQSDETVVHIAALFGNLDAVMFFLRDDQNMEVNIMDATGLTPLDYALKSDFEQGKRLDTGLALYAAGGKFKEIANSTGQTWLHLSALNGNIQSIQLLLKIGGHVNASDEDRNTPLHSLLWNWDSSKTPVLELLLDNHSNPSLLNRNELSPFHFALMCDHLDIQTFKLLKSKTNLEWTPTLASSVLNTLIVSGSDLNDAEFGDLAKEMEDHGADFGFQDEHGNSRLHNAIIHNHTRAIRFLLKKQGGVNVNSRNNLQQTPLHLVAQNELGAEVIKLLIENSGDAEAKDYNHETFLHVYISKDPETTDLHSLVIFLVSKNLGYLFNINGGGNNVTPFQLAVEKVELKEETLSLLNSNGVDFNAISKFGMSVLGYAVQGHRTVHFLFHLIKFGADWKALTNNKSSILHLSAAIGTPESLDFFLGLGGLNVNGVDGDGDTPFHYAVCQRGKQGVLEKCKTLMEAGADENILNVKGRTALDYARLVRADDVYEELRCLIVDHKVKSKMVLKDKEKTLISLDLETIKSLAESGADVFEKDEENYTILHKFVLQSTTPTPSEFHSVSEYLLDTKFSDLLNCPGGKRGATPFQEAVSVLEIHPVTLSLLHSELIDFNAVDKDGDSLLFYAIKGRRSIKFITNLAKEYGADVTHRNNQEESLLHCAVNNGTSEALKFFLDFGNLDVNGKNKNGFSPLHALVNSGDDMFEEEALTKYRLLVEHGADVNSKCNRHNSPLHSSADNRRKDVCLKIVKHLLQDGADLYARNSISSTFLHNYITYQPRPTSSEFNDMVMYLKGEGYIDIFNQGDENGSTPILLAILNLEPEEKTMSILYRSGISFNTVDRYGNTILRYAILGRRSKNFLFMMVTQYGVCPNNISSYGDNLLYLLPIYHSAETLKYFLDLSLSGLDVNGKDKYGRTPLLYTARFATEGVLQKCKLLISHGADISVGDDRQRTPLHVLAESQDKDIALKTIKYLIEQGADVFAKDEDSRTFLHVYFFTLTVVPSPSGVHSLLEYLLSKDFASIFNIPGGKYGRTSLQLMLRYVEPELQTLALLHSRAVNFSAIDNEGYSVLSHAVIGGRSKELLSSLMIQFGANHNCLNHSGESILHTATWFGTVDALKLFADLDDVDINGKTTDQWKCTPLIYALHPNNKKIDVLEKCKLLISKGADVNIANKKGETPLSIVMKSYEGADKNELITLLEASVRR